MAERPLPIDLETVTVDELQALMVEGTLTSVELTDACLARIERLDRAGPALHALRVVAPSARADAARADRIRAEGGGGPLLGIPVVIKDNIDVAGLPTPAGSVALAEAHPPGDAFVTGRIRAAGAVILAKANLTEFANFMSTHMPSGYSSLGGQVLNPYDVRLDPSGSSAGSPAAVVAGLAPLAVGTETSGSILAPSEAQSAVGIKPTVGLVSRTGIVPISHTQDTAGPIARTVADAALLLEAMAGVDPEDLATVPGPPGAPDYRAELRTGALDGARLGVVTSFDAALLPDQQALWQAAQEAMVARGATLVPVALPYPMRPLGVLVYEFAEDLARYLARLPEPAPARTLADIVASNDAQPGVALKFGQDRLLQCLASDPERDRKAYEEERADDLAASRDRIDAALAGADLAALVWPGVEGYDAGARAGYPSITVPAGYWLSTRQPFGIQFMGRAWDEGRLIGLAYDYEQATRLRRPPSEINPTLFRG